MVDTIGLVNAVTGAPAYNGRKLRQLNGVGFAGATAARPLGVRSGVRPGTPSTTVTATSTTWTCQPFAGIIDGQAAVEAGAYTFAFDAVATGAITAASASIARVDIIYVQVDDPAESDGSTVPAVTRKYLAGTVASTPPATPARSIVIAHINVPISGVGSPTVMWKAPYCAAAGGVVNFNTKAEMDMWTTASEGQQACVIQRGSAALDGSYSWNGAAGAWLRTAPHGLISSGVIGTSGAGVVTAPPSTAVPEIRVGRVAALTVSNGIMPELIFPVPFPNGVTSISLTTINGSAINPVIDGGKLNQISFTCVYPSAPAGSSMVYAYTAFGW